MRCNLAYGIAGQCQVHQTRHVYKVLPTDSRDEVVREPQLYGLAVNSVRHKEESSLGTKQGQGGRDGLADTSAWALLSSHQNPQQHHAQNEPLHGLSASSSCRSHKPRHKQRHPISTGAAFNLSDRMHMWAVEHELIK